MAEAGVPLCPQPRAVVGMPAATALAPVGAPGTVIANGVTALLGAENALVPCAFVAETMNV